MKYGADTTAGVKSSRFNFAMHDNIGFIAYRRILSYL